MRVLSFIQPPRPPRDCGRQQARPFQGWGPEWFRGLTDVVLLAVLGAVGSTQLYAEEGLSTSAAALELPRPAPAGADAVAYQPPHASVMGPARDAKAVNAECASCHTEIAAEWAASLHRQAWVDPVFQSAYAIEQRAFCRGCHAPEAPAFAEPDAAAAHVGVACTTCHVDAGAVVSDAASGHAPHATRSDPRRATVDACASCHQFDFPASATAMQNTVEEHARSQFADVPCQGCHMPPAERADGTRYRSHAFSVVGNTPLLRSAVKASARRTGPRTVELTIEPGVVGHSVPTGDMFRRLEVRAHAVDANGMKAAQAAPITLARRFADKTLAAHGLTGFIRRQVGDTRLPPPGRAEESGRRVITLTFDQPVARAEVRWSVAYQRMDGAMAASFGIDAAADETIIADGVIASPSSPNSP